MSLAVFLVSVSIFFIVFFLFRNPSESSELASRIAGGWSKKTSDGRKINIEKKTHFSDIEGLTSILGRQRMAPVLALYLARAGFKITVFSLLLICLAVGIFGYVFLQPKLGTLLAALAGLTLTVIPLIYLNIQNKRYLYKFRTHFGDALSIMANAIKVGHGIEKAFQTAVSASPHPVSTELSVLLRETEFGVSFREALIHFRQRVPVEEVKIFVTALTIHDELGGNLSDMLRNIEDMIRQRFALEREVKALTSQGKYSFGVVTVVPLFMIGFWLLVARDDYLAFLASTIGKVMMAWAAFCFISGLFLLNLFTKIED